MRDTRRHLKEYLWLLIAAALLTIPGLVGAQQGAWSLSVEASSVRYIVREPIWTRVVLTNQSGQEVPKAGAYGELYLDGSDRPCRPYSGPTGPEVVGEGKGEHNPPEAAPGAEVAVWLNAAEQCRLSRDGAASIGHHKICYRDEESAGLRNRSACVSFSIEAPEGVDRDTYQAFGHDPLKDSERYGELLRRFPKSTYAAYVVWHRLASGVDRGTTEGYLSIMQESPDRFGNSVPCDETAPCTKHGWMSLKGSQYLEWRVGWFEVVLEHHPTIWFADEIRLRLALDRYVLGDEAGSAALLDELGQHGRSDIAAKASELLTALKKRGMLSGPSSR